MKKQIGQWRTLGFSDLSDAKLNVVTLYAIRCACTQLKLRQDTCGRREIVSGVNVKHFSMFYSSLQEQRSRVRLCVSNWDRANERKSKQRGGGEGIHQGVCLQPERAASTGLRDEIRFSIRETCLDCIRAPQETQRHRNLHMGLYIWKRTQGDELFMDCLLVLRNFLFIHSSGAAKEKKRKGDKKLYHTCLLI